MITRFLGGTFCSNSVLGGTKTFCRTGQPTASQQVIYIIQMPKEPMANAKKSYLVRAATTLGGIHIVCGIGVLIASVTGLVFSAFSTGEYLNGLRLH